MKITAIVINELTISNININSCAYLIHILMFPVKMTSLLKIAIMLYHHQILDSFFFFWSSCFLSVSTRLVFFWELTDRRPRCSARQFLSGKKYYLWINLGNIHLWSVTYISYLFWGQKGSLNRCVINIFSQQVHTCIVLKALSCLVVQLHTIPILHLTLSDIVRWIKSNYLLKFIMYRQIQQIRCDGAVL